MYDVRTGREIKPRENSEPLNLRNHSLYGFAVPVGAPKVNAPPLTLGTPPVSTG